MNKPPGVGGRIKNSHEKVNSGNSWRSGRCGRDGGELAPMAWPELRRLESGKEPAGEMVEDGKRRLDSAAPRALRFHARHLGQLRLRLHQRQIHALALGDLRAQEDWRGDVETESGRRIRERRQKQLRIAIAHDR